ncbi:MAG TPA: methyltransferase domain-containing protein [Terriglobia bacterium]|nr:methyltransferase domain-containing protein [Terriglobia bacterium]
MPGRVCPWWLGYLLASPLRRWLEDPAELLAPYVRSGMTVLEPGPGMGFFTMELARLVGPQGRVVAPELQHRMVAGLKRRAVRAGLTDRIDARVVPPDTLGVDDLAGRVDFALVYAVVHEMPDAARFFTETAAALKPGGTLLLAEPAGHVKPPEFEAEISLAAQVGLKVVDSPAIRRSHSALLKKS